MTKKQKTWIASIVGIALLLLFAGIGWAISRREDPQVAKVRELQSKAFSRETDGEQRRELFEKMRSESEKLSDKQRDSLRSEVRDQRTQEMRERIDGYLAMNSEQREAYLDEQIDEMEQRRKEWQKMAKEREARGDDQRRGAGGERGRGGGAGGGRGRGRDANRTAEDRNDRRRGFLSHSSADDRAKFTAYIEDLNERREARGMEPMGRGGPGGGRRGR